MSEFPFLFLFDLSLFLAMFHTVSVSSVDTSCG